MIRWVWALLSAADLRRDPRFTDILKRMNLPSGGRGGSVWYRKHLPSGSLRWYSAASGEGNRMIRSVWALLSATGLFAATEHFPVVGGNRNQSVAIRIVGLGTKDTWCTAALGFRSVSGERLGEDKVVALRLGGSQRHVLRLADLGLSEAERAEVRPVVELGNPLSECWPAVEVSHGSAVAGFVSGAALRMKRPGDARLSPFLDLAAGEAARVTLYRVDRGDPPPCSVRAGFRSSDGNPHGEERFWTLEPGEVKHIDYVPDSKGRVLIDVRPLADGGAAGCVAAAQVYESRNGTTLRVVPMALPHTPELLGVPPSPDSPHPVHPDEASSDARPIGRVVQIRSPLGLPPVPIPDGNPPTAETIALGRRLFYDTVLSADGTISCASCHDPAAGFSDPRRLSLGVNGVPEDRHSMSILNAALSAEVFWEGRSNGLEAQARMPVIGAKEFAHNLDGVEKRLQADPLYVRLFADAWGPGPITYDMAAKSLATFQRTLLSGNSAFDRYMFGNDRNALSESALRALLGFQGAPGCNQCHNLETPQGFATFGNDKFFNTGVTAVDFDTLRDQGRWDVSHAESDRGAFRPPSLRNAELTAPYMHNGSFDSISSVAIFYASGGRSNRWLSPVLIAIGPARGRTLPAQDIEDINNFVRALTGEMPENAGPPEE